MRRSIPRSLAQDRATIALVTRWRNLLREHELCCTRVSYKTIKNAKDIERKRRSRRWDVDVSIEELESTLLRFIAEATHSPELWSPPIVEGDPLDFRSFSKLDQLHHRYYRANKRAGALHSDRNAVNRVRTQTRKVLVAKISNLRWAWLLSLYTEIFPGASEPPRRKINTRVLRPKRIRDRARSKLI